MKTSLTRKRLKKLLCYEADSGNFYWLIRKGPKRNKGDVAGCLHKQRGKFTWIGIGIDGIEYRASRLAFLYMTGKWPELLIDHINGNPLDNRWKNLREASNKENSRSCCRPSHNTSKIKGVSWHKLRQKWRASIKVDGRQCHIGLFISKEEAAIAYHDAQIKYFGDFARVA